MKIKNRLPALMGEKRVKSITQLSKDTGLSTSTLYNFYHERYETFNGELVKTLCIYFGCQVGDLLFLGEDGQAS